MSAFGSVVYAWLLTLELVALVLTPVALGAWLFGIWPGLHSFLRVGFWAVAAVLAVCSLPGVLR